MPTSHTPAMTKKQFRAAITAADHLKLYSGLSAIPPSEGRHKIVARDPAHLQGSVNIDEDCRRTFPNDSRWDFVVGYHKNTGVFAYFIEEHSATSSEVSCMERKLHWLKNFLNCPANAALKQLPSQFHWLAHNGVHIPLNTPQYRQLQRLRGRGLLGPAERLELS